MRKKLLTAVVGSVNCNLNDEKSDVDKKLFVLPNNLDLYKGEFFSEFKKDEEGNDIDIKDIRLFKNLLYKEDINFLQVLFSLKIDIEPNLTQIDKDYIEFLFKYKEQLVKLNLSRLFEVCMGLYKQNKPHLLKRKESSAYLFDKYGYNTKIFMTSYRLLDFIERYYNTDFQNFEKAFRYNTEEREKMLSLKYGKYNKEEAFCMLEEKSEYVLKYKEFYRNSKPNDKLLEILDYNTEILINSNKIEPNKKIYMGVD